MKRWTAGVALIWVSMLTIGTADAADDQAEKKRDPDAMFKKLDANGDGKVTKEEFSKFADALKDKLGADKADKIAQGMQGMFDRLDANKDGSLSADEFKGFGGGGFKGKGKGKPGAGNFNPEELKKKLQDLKANGGNPEEIRQKLQELFKDKNINPEDLKKKFEEFKKKKAGDN
ncbi:MAG: EF-hand domain-containing protein [Planctomycetia bacterium]|nr:EF-hand domain-containing protein [Planctomycetia bacterium]